MDQQAVLDGAHGHGYLLLGRSRRDTDPLDLDLPAPPAVVHGWPEAPAPGPGLRLLVHPRTRVARASGSRGAVVLLGHPVDVAAGLADADAIARRLVATWDAHGDATAEGALVRAAALLGGRWTLLAATGERLLVVPDTHASQPVLHATAGDRLAVASGANLVAASLGLEEDEDALALLAELDARREHAVTYLPGRRTPYLGVDPLLPNCLLRIDLRPLRLRHERFWPWQERVEVGDVDAVWRDFRDRITEHTRLLAGLGRPVVSLTAGGDSRVTAAVALPWLQERDGFTFTYVNPRDVRGSLPALTDVTGASAVAQQLGVPHRLLRWRQPPRGGTFDVLHRRTYAPLTPSRGAAHAMWADLPRDIVQLQSNCAETGTVFVRHRTDEPLSPLRLARIMMNATEGLEDLADRMYAGYLEHAELHPDRLLGYDHHDLLYWEQRIGRWGYQKFLDGDLGHRVLLPFNDRVLVETMLSLPEPQRAARVLFEKVWAEEPRARVPGHGTTPTTLALRGAARLPAPVGRPVARVLTGLRRRRSLGSLTFPDGFAVHVPTGPRSHVPGHWPRLALPDPEGVVLRRHPRLSHALAAEDHGSRWVLVLGRPADLEAGRVGAHAVAAALLATFRAPRDIEAALGALARDAARLVGRYVVLAGGQGRRLAVPDPLTSLGLHDVDGGTGGLVSHALLAPGRTSPVRPDQLLVTLPDGTPTRRALPEVRHGIPGRAARLAAHVRLVGGATAVWLGMTPGGSTGELLPVVARSAGTALSWWDRQEEGPAVRQVFDDAAAAWRAGVRHRVVGVREDVDGSRGEPGRSARALALAGLRETWGEEQSEGVPAVSTAVHEAMPAGVNLVLGTTAAGRVDLLADRPWDLLQGVRRVILPFSDRAL